MSDLPQAIVRLADLSARKPTSFDLAPDAAARAAVAADLGIPEVRKLTFRGTLRPMSRSDWVLEADLGATVVQECVVTLAPVTTRIDEPVRRVYAAELPDLGAGEVEMPEDDTVEPLPAAVDLAHVMIEALALALPPFPRAEGVALGAQVYTEPGQTPMTDDDARPFAGLGALRDKLARDDDADGGAD